MKKPANLHEALLERRQVLDALRDLAGALPPAPNAYTALQVIEELGEVAVGVCLNELSSPHTGLRHAVAASLRHLEAGDVVSVLEEIQEDPKVPDENRAIARELFRDLRPKAAPTSFAFPIPTREDPGPGRALLDTLDEEPVARSSFLAAWSAAPAETRLTVIEGLAALRDARGIVIFEAASADREARVAQAAIEGLVACPDPRAREVLEELAGGSRGAQVRRIAGRYLMGLKPDPPEAKRKAAHSVVGPLDLRGERDLLLAAPRTGGTRWDLLRVRLGVRGGILSVEARPNISAASASSAAARLVNDGGYLSPGPAYARLLLEDALAAPEAGPNRLGSWRSLLGTKPLSPRPYRSPVEIPRGEAKSTLRVAERLLRRPEFRGWFVSDPHLDDLRSLVQSGDAANEGEVMEHFLNRFVEPRRAVLLRSLELTRDLFLRRGDRSLAKAVAAAEWALRDPDPRALAKDPFFVCLVRQRVCSASFEPATGL